VRANALNAKSKHREKQSGLAQTGAPAALTGVYSHVVCRSQASLGALHKIAPVAFFAGSMPVHLAHAGSAP
jgi:hypothetical protein